MERLTNRMRIQSNTYEATRRFETYLTPAARLLTVLPRATIGATEHATQLLDEKTPGVKGSVVFITLLKEADPRQDLVAEKLSSRNGSRKSHC